jgi:hypothetical protein
MTAEDKARELLLKFYPNVQWKLGQEDCVKRAKSCALIAIDEIIKGVERAFDEYEKATGIYVKNRIFYWDFYSDVKSEIYKL